MKLVADANVVIAALLRDAGTRRLLLLGGHEVHVPDYLFDEIEAHRGELAARLRRPTDIVNEVLDLLRGHLIEHRAAEYKPEMALAEGMLRGRDPKDVPYVALALALHAEGIWSEDRGLVSQPPFRVFRTTELVRMAERSPRL